VGVRIVKRRKKNAKMAVSTLIAIIICLLLALVLIVPGVKMLTRTKASFDAFGISKCTDSEKARRPPEFLEVMQTFGQREREKGAPNELYSPEDAIKQFKIYLACLRDGMYTHEEIAQFDAEIKFLAKAAYVSFAEDICKIVTTSEIKDEKKAQEKKHTALLDDYIKTFKGESFEGPGRCETPADSAKPGPDAVQRDLDRLRTS
jgi:hypothetical protein